MPCRKAASGGCRRSGRVQSRHSALRRGDQTMHLRGVTKLALSIADEFATEIPEARIERDVVIAGGLTA